MFPFSTYKCPFCHRNFVARPPSIISCPHCNSMLRIDSEGVYLISPGIRPTPAGVPVVGGAVAGAIIGAAVGGAPGAVIGGLVGLLMGSAAGQRERQE